MTMRSVLSIRKGDIIVERNNGKKRMTPVTKVEFNACSTKGSVHVNRNACYEPAAMVELIDGEGTLGDMEKEMTGLGDLEEDYGLLLTVGSGDALSDEFVLSTFDDYDKLADRLVKQ